MRSCTTATWIAVIHATAAGVVLAQSPADFSSRVQVSVPAGTSTARVVLPASTFASMRTADGGDLRVFNASGQILPYAWVNAASQPQSRPDAQGVRLPALPIHGERASPSGAGSTLRIIEGSSGQRRVIEYSAAANAATVTPKTAVPATTDVRGLLFDARKIEAVTRAIELDGTLPSATIVKITVAASTDLTSWRVLAADAPVYEFPATEGATSGPGNRRINLPSGISLKDQYLRLTWSGVAAPPGITALRTVGVGETTVVPPVSVDLGAPTSSSDEAVQWTLPTPYRAQALRLVTSAGNALMPVRVSTRARAGEPWRTVANGVVYRLTGADGVSSVNPSQPITQALEREVRVEALPGYRLSGVPLTLTLEFAPLHVLFVATGDGPFTIASGKAGLASAALPIATLMPGYRVGDEFKLPVFTVATGAGTALPGNTSISSPSTGKLSGGVSASDWLNRTTVLWGVLLLAVLVLGGLAVQLLRSPAKRK